MGFSFESFILSRVYEVSLKAEYTSSVTVLLVILMAILFQQLRRCNSFIVRWPFDCCGSDVVAPSVLYLSQFV